MGGIVKRSLRSRTRRALVYVAWLVACRSDATDPGVVQLVFNAQPSNVTAGVTITPPIAVSALDANGNPASRFAGNVTIAIGTNPSSGVLSGTTTVAAIAGVATFSDLRIDKTGVGYSLQATSGGLASPFSVPITVTPAAASQLSFSVQPSSTGAGAAMTPAVQVTARDALGNLATGFGGPVSLVIGTNPSGGTLSGATSQDATAGVAVFGGLSIDKAGVGYSLTATSGTLTAATSTGFTITAGGVSASQSTVIASASAITAGSNMSTITVTAKDAIGNPISGATVVLSATGTGNTLSQPAASTDAFGVASGTLSSTVAESKTVSATVNGIGLIQTAGVTVIPAAASALVFTGHPSTVGAGVTISPSVQVTAYDQFGNTATAYSGLVSIALGANPGGGVLSGTIAQTAVAGVASFLDLSIDKAGTGYTLTASGVGLSAGASNAFDITVGGVSASQSTVNAAPTSITASAGSSLSTITVIAMDAFGNPLQGVTAVLAATGSGNTLTQPVGTTNASGVATGTLSSTMAESKTISATIDGVDITQTAAVLVSPAAANALVFTSQPSTSEAGAPITPAVMVTAVDQFANTATAFTVDVIVAIGANPSGGTLAGTTTRSAVSGVAAFNDLSIDKTGTGYTLTATSGSLNQTSATFAISAGAPDHLTITVQPSNTTAGAAITSSIQVEIRDQLDNLATGASNSITLAIAANPGGGTLSGTTSNNALAGVATFSGLSIDKAGSGYTLRATSGGLTLDTSAPFDIAAGLADHLAFAVQPSNTVAASAIAPAVQLAIQDQFGNLVTGATTSVTAGLASNPAGGSLSGTTTQAAVAGVATFSELSIDKAGTRYTLAATAGGLNGDTSSTFDITVGPAAKLGFFGQPTTAPIGAIISPPVQIEIQDEGGNRVTSATNSVALAIGSNPGGGTLSGGGAVPAVGGVATFSNLSVNQSGTGYTLVATAPTLIADTSTAFDIVSVPDHLAFLVQPSNATAGAAISPSIEVEIQDVANNRVASATNSITLAIANNPSGGTLSGTNTIAAVAGVATFSGLSINKAGVGYTLQATSGALTATNSTGFNITAGSVAQLSFIALPASVPAGAPILPAVQVAAQDALGNPTSGYTGDVTLAIANNPSAGALTGTTTVAAVAGVATFTNARIDSTGVGFTLRATSGLLADTISAPFDVTDPVLVGAGDIADCTKVSDDATANLLDGIAGIVFVNGDNAYPYGRAQDFANCYDPTWGRHKARTLPVTGNHEYDSSATAADHRAYFGAAVADPLNNGGYYYSYDLGAWHIVVLNTDIPIAPQVTWLQADLAGRTTQCILALWHRAIFTSGSSGGRPSARPLWQALQDASAEVVINGHDHLYQRFALQDSLGNADPTGIREFIAGTGGGETHSNFPNTVPNVETDDRNNFSRGVLKLTLHPSSYSWEFIPASGFGTFTDSGTAACH